MLASKVSKPHLILWRQMPRPLVIQSLTFCCFSLITFAVYLTCFSETILMEESSIFMYHLVLLKLANLLNVFSMTALLLSCHRPNLFNL